MYIFGVLLQHWSLCDLWRYSFQDLYPHLVTKWPPRREMVVLIPSRYESVSVEIFGSFCYNNRYCRDSSVVEHFHGKDVLSE